MKDSRLILSNGNESLGAKMKNIFNVEPDKPVFPLSFQPRVLPPLEKELPDTHAITDVQYWRFKKVRGN